MGRNKVKNGESLSGDTNLHMLAGNEEEGLANKHAMKLMSNDIPNSDINLDPEKLEQTFTGLTKEELMKFATSRFWIRLRWTFFIIFWVLWILMLLTAILIITNAPKCATPTALAWYKLGPLVKAESYDVENDLASVTKVKAKGVIYDLPPEETYLVKTPDIEARINRIVNYYKDHDVKVILDVTPNYVTKDSELFQEALQDESKRSPFLWVNSATIPNNWISKDGRPAWEQMNELNTFVLSQFGQGKYDLQMNDENVKSKLKDVLEHLISLGVQGFRLANVEHYIINRDLKNEEQTGNTKYDLSDYEFWTHTQTTFQPGLASLLDEFAETVHNATNGDGFLSVADDIKRPEAFKLKSDSLVIDIPKYGPLTEALKVDGSSIDSYENLRRTFNALDTSLWLQWDCEFVELGTMNPSAYYIFFNILPGVPVYRVDSSLVKNVSDAVVSQIQNIRSSASCMHGVLQLHDSPNLLAYSRSNPGNPGYFVMLNPTGQHVTANFTMQGLPNLMTVELLSDNFNSTDVEIKNKLDISSVRVSPYSTLVLTYVAVKSN